jgi:hypothetical protein
VQQGQAPPRPASGDAVDLFSLVGPALERLGRYAKTVEPRHGERRAPPSSRGPAARSHSTLVTRDTSSTPGSVHSPRVSGARPANLGRVALVVTVVVLAAVGLVLLAALVTAGPDADLGATVSGWFS